MFGIDIDDRPDAPVATPEVRRTVAIKWNWTTAYKKEDMAKALGVRPETVSRYLRDGPNEEVRELVHDMEAEVRTVAVMELKQQLREAGDRARTAKKPVKVYENGAGEVVVKDIRDESGEVVKRVPKVQDIQMLPDEEARYYARAEARDILEQLTDLVGAGEADEVEVSLTDALRD